MFNSKLVKSKMGAYLKSKRNSVGLTQKEVSKHFNYTTPQFVSNWERGLIDPPMGTLLELRALYKVNEHQYFEDLLQFQKAQLKSDFGYQLEDKDFPQI